ncbi:MAG: c-type cytochrome [Planctomycetia bacterium]|nr:c-type cytochrome [Planctomycetia bacterium]
MNRSLTLWTSILLVIPAFLTVAIRADEKKPAVADAAIHLYDRDNLVAWCIVPFDSKKRGPVERVAMLKRLGFRHYAYDWRDEHVPTFDTEVVELQKHGIELTSVWFPGLDANGRKLLDVLKARGVKTQLWVTGGGEPTRTPEEQKQRVIAEANRLRPIAEAAAAMGSTVGLYNHGGWFGEPENQLAILAELKLPNVGIVYNLHHGHTQLDRFPELLKKMLPHLYVLNLNGMVAKGDQQGQKILPLGAGDLDLGLLKTIRDSGYKGPIGILGHTNDDAEERLRDNLDGLDWLLPQLQGAKPGAKPKYRTPVPTAAAPAAAGGPAPAAALVEGKFGKALDARAARAEVGGRTDYRDPPITVECWARLFDKQLFNILVANEPKSSGTHWELFTFAGTGRLTVYVPGMIPDHVHSEAVITDGRWHHLAFIYEPRRARLYVDGKQVADTPIESKKNPPQAGGLAIGSLVTHDIGCAGLIDEVRVSRGVREIKAIPDAPLKADESTLGLWRFDTREEQRTRDEGTLNQPARLVSSPTRAASVAPEPPAGLQHVMLAKNVQARLIDRSENDVFMAVKTDPQGRVFVGGREGVFVYEPKPDGGFHSRRELYHFAQDSIIIGLEWRGNDLFVLTSSALYVLPEGRVKREGLKPQRLLWGVPLDLHVSFHCLAWGPEGDLYLTHGDPLLQFGDWSRPDHWGHWTLHMEPGDRKLPYTGSGAVLRLKLSHATGWRVDDVEVVATGLRGPVGLAFDTEWNLFTNDNDHESMADRYAPAKLLHVTPHIDFGWPRGWMASKSPDRFDLIEPVSADLGRGVPCDLVFYDEPALGDDVRGKLLMARWDRHAVTAYPLIPRGASFSTTEETIVEGQNNARPVGLGVGHDGRLFVTSLFLAGNVASPYCYSDLIVVEPIDKKAAAADSTYDPVAVPAERLWAELESTSWLRRGWAHQEILRRGGKLVDEEAVSRLTALLPEAPRPDVKRLPDPKQARLQSHLIWLAAASRSRRAVESIMKAAEPAAVFALRLQALRALIDLSRPVAETADQPAERAKNPPAAGLCRTLFLEASGDPDPRMQLVGLQSFFLPTLHENDSSAAGYYSNDTYVRQTAATLLAERAPYDNLFKMLKLDPDRRLIGTLAAGIRLTVPRMHREPPAELALSLPPEGAFFKLKLPFADVSEPVNISSSGRNGSFTIAQYWKVIPHTPEQEKLFEALRARLDDRDERVRLQAAYYLGLLRDPRSEELIDQTRDDVLAWRFKKVPHVVVEQAWILAPVPADAARATPEFVKSPVDLNAPQFGLSWTASETTQEGFPFPQASGPASAFVYFRVQSGSRQTGLLRGEIAGVWQNGVALKALATVKPSEVSGWPVDLQPGSNDLLVRVDSRPATGTGKLLLKAPSEIAVVLPEKLDSNLLAERLRAAGEGAGQAVPREFIDVDWPARAKSGNKDQGRRLFGTLGCVKCHAITADQKGGGGPSLTEVKRRFTTLHLVESVLLPSKQVADAFRGTTIVTTDGQVLSGLVVTDDADQIELLLADTTRRTIPKSKIEERKPNDLSPMPAGLVKSVGELEDLLAYLLSDNPQPP